MKKRNENYGLSKIVRNVTEYDNEEDVKYIQNRHCNSVFFGVFIGSYLQAKETLYKKYY